MKPIVLSLTARARRDIEQHVAFVSRFPGGKPDERRRAIHAALQKICEFPEQHRVEVKRRRSGLELRRHYVDQFAIVYAYLPSVDERSWAIVTVRAVQHRRVRDVFFGVRENTSAEGVSPLRLT
jgi:hypothetical protein